MIRPAALILILSASSASAEQVPLWLRMEFAGVGMATSGQMVRALEVDLYYARYGVGAGVATWQAEFGAWDVPRHGRTDASAHMVSTFFPVKAYATLWSFEGPPFYHQRQATRTIGRVELFGEFSDWAKLGQFTQSRIDILGDEERVGIDGSVPTRRIDYGVRFDYGQVFGFSVGRREFRSERTDVFQSRYDAAWYGQFFLYFGLNMGEQSGSLVQVPRDLAALARRVFRRKPKYTDIIVE